MNQNRLLSKEIQEALPPSMPYKWKEISDIVCKTIKEIRGDLLPTEVPLSYTSNIFRLYFNNALSDD